MNWSRPRKTKRKGQSHNAKIATEKGSESADAFEGLQDDSTRERNPLRSQVGIPHLAACELVCAGNHPALLRKPDSRENSSHRGQAGNAIGVMLTIQRARAEDLGEVAREICGMAGF